MIIYLIKMMGAHHDGSQTDTVQTTWCLPTTE